MVRGDHFGQNASWCCHLNPAWQKEMRRGISVKQLVDAPVNTEFEHKSFCLSEVCWYLSEAVLYIKPLAFPVLTQVTMWHLCCKNLLEQHRVLLLIASVSSSLTFVRHMWVASSFPLVWSTSRPTARSAAQLSSASPQLAPCSSSSSWWCSLLTSASLARATWPWRGCRCRWTTSSHV